MSRGPETTREPAHSLDRRQTNNKVDRCSEPFQNPRCSFEADQGHHGSKDVGDSDLQRFRVVKSVIVHASDDANHCQIEMQSLKEQVNRVVAQAH